MSLKKNPLSQKSSRQTAKERFVESLNQDDDFLRSSLFDKEIHFSRTFESPQANAFLPGKRKSVAKYILEEEIFKLKQSFESLRVGFKEFVMSLTLQFQRVAAGATQGFVEEAGKRGLEATIQEMRGKISSIELTNKALKLENSLMAVRIQNLTKSGLPRDIQNEPLFPPRDFTEENQYLIDCLRTSQSRIRQLEANNQPEHRIERHNSELQLFSSFRPLPSTLSPSSAHHRPSIYTPSRSSLNHLFSHHKHPNPNPNPDLRSTPTLTQQITFRAPSTQIREQRKRLISRKPQLYTHKANHTSVNFEKLECQIASIRKDLKSEIRSVEKRK